MSITASDVSYHYPNRGNLFDHLSFSVSPYEKVSIIGNNLDIASLSILEDTVGSYQGTVIVISHDDHFVGEIGTTRTIGLESRIHPGLRVPVNAR